MPDPSRSPDIPTLQAALVAAEEKVAALEAELATSRNFTKLAEAHVEQAYQQRDAERSQAHRDLNAFRRDREAAESKLSIAVAALERIAYECSRGRPHLADRIAREALERIKADD